jgi:hypothetical protein
MKGIYLDLVLLQIPTLEFPMIYCIIARISKFKEITLVLRLRDG